MARKNQRTAQPEEALKTPPGPEQVARAAELRQAIGAIRAGVAKPARTPREFTDDAARKAAGTAPAKRARPPAKKRP